MSTNGAGERDLRVLKSKRDASRYQILVAIADRQPAVSQQEIADTVGITAQAVSEYVQELTDEGYVETQGRGRYTVTKEGVDWLISRTDDLRDFARFVAEEIIGHVETETAIATDDIAANESVTLSMIDGTLCATPNGSGSVTAIAITDANEGQDVGVTDFEGLHEYEIGAVTILVVPEIRNGGVAPSSAKRPPHSHQITTTLPLLALKPLRLPRAPVSLPISDLAPRVLFPKPPQEESQSCYSLPKTDSLITPNGSVKTGSDTNSSTNEDSNETSVAQPKRAVQTS
ncbi:MarR family transcriptional regulator [Halocatena marina]|uniref:MarR family transcriptional regulator n=1 Tax=Halocatena marina TaxID=2934937 RepID=UPI0036210274